MFKQKAIYIFLIPFFIFFTNSNLNAENDYLISYLSVKDGLSHNEVTSIAKDKYGFLWFGTRGGLNRYYGYGFIHFKPDNNTEQILHNPSIERLYPDSKGNIWIGTKSGGISYYNLKTEIFKHLTNTTHSLPDRVISFLEDYSGAIWVGGWQKGILKYSPETGSFKHFLGQDRVSCIVQTEDSTIWCATSTGLRYGKKDEPFKKLEKDIGSYEITKIIKDTDEHALWIIGWGLQLIKFNYDDFTVTKYNFPFEKKNEPSNAYSMMADSKGNIWIGTWGNGLYLFNKEKEKFSHILIKPVFLNSKIRTDYDVILDIFEDNIGDVWIGTDGGGVVKLSEKNRFNVIHSFDGNRFSKQHVNTVFVDNDEKLWIGTKGDGLFMSTDKTSFIKIGFEPSLRKLQRSFLVVKNIYQDSDRNIWVSFNEGLFIVRKKGSEYILFDAGDYFNSLSLKKIKKAHSIYTSKDTLWIGTQQRGLFCFVKKNGQYLIKNHFVKGIETGQLTSNRVTNLLKDKKGRLWIGTYGGLFLFNPNNSAFIPLHTLLNETDASYCNMILTLSSDEKNNIWIGTPCCLSKLTETKNNGFVLERFSKSNGLPDDYINGILSDNKGNIWITTNAGISRLDTETNEIRNFYDSDGVGDSNFSEGAFFKDRNGILYFGGYTGLTFFNPALIKENNVIPDIVITDFKVLNRRVPIEPDGALKSSINDTKHLTLTYKEKEFSFEFAVPDFRAPERNKYAYWLENYNDDWVYIGERRHISFNNLNAGKYILHFAGSNSKGFWNKSGKKIIIDVLPPPWKTWYALIAYIFIGFGLIFIVRWNTIKQEQLKKSVEIEKLIREQEHEVSEMKLRFFTNVSHEFRTPLTLIVALLKELEKDAGKLPDEIKKKLDIVYNNSGRLMKLVNQLMQFRKTETGNIKLNASYNDINTFLYEMALPFKELAAINDINFSNELRIKNSYYLFDTEKMEVILNNLLSNAFKFTSRKGNVKLTATDSDNEIVISVEDNGIGISGEEQKHIFERFYQAEEGTVKRGTGIGLALTKQFIELHNGSITVKSEKDKGSVFTILLPRGDRNSSVERREPSKPYEIIHTEPVRSINYNLNIKTNKNIKILVVEDNQEVRNYLEDLFAKHFSVLTSENGLTGYDTAKKELPDIIISDVMMPGMDGFELCESIKSNERTNTIPVILLTAKTAEQYKLLGVNKGADAYISKPFDPDFLLITVRNILKSYKKIEKKFSKKIILGPENIEVTSSEERLVTKVNELLEKHFSDPDFDTGALASMLFVSQATLYRKLKPVVNMTPAEYIRYYRMKHAAQLLVDKDKTVSEIAFEAGFLDIKSFRSAFVKQFGKTPSKYRDSL